MKCVHFNFTSLETAKQHVNIDEYLDILGKIQAISDSFESTNTFIIGDFNADIKNPSLFTPFLNAFINDCHLIASDTLLLPSDAFTYVSDAQGITVAYNNSFRIIHNLSPCCSASHMFATNYVKSFNERIRSSIFSFLCRLD